MLKSHLSRFYGYVPVKLNWYYIPQQLAFHANPSNVIQKKPADTNSTRDRNYSCHAKLISKGADSCHRNPSVIHTITATKTSIPIFGILLTVASVQCQSCMHFVI